ncbi:two-component regulator propeller domain-containing protein [Flammeovirga kamogawensis]|uniref:HTH luxR-type domain-containing protein n=1 Tax=Flammeovirga kamogawensis TaxID=373891 RepID=A0ABX8GZK7_9BACT|nr:two-component regulator propeller domain-containing protein [Flammeovirga kamogawensis]MBB6459491.1 ligand-binding sensor domain-containing protein/DNA-binding CsgD family transcriptional regulator [Flammeovirga kamogawensis]QWG09043.1 hypothetical protein KM029_08890 [Flammeovirga kamogawensis]TRX67331.1 hypothetical protein EO216_03930 [Flammeovirga kamogawensis]
MKLTTLSFITVFFCLFPILLNAQSNFKFDSYQTKEGLIHNHVLSIYQDSRDLLWVGTYGGVQIYDGHEFHNFNTVGKEKANILSHTTVQCIFEDANNNMWFGTEHGLNKYEVETGKTTTFFKDNNGLSSDNIRSIIQDDSVLWIGTYNGGLVKYDENAQKFTSFNTINPYKDKVSGRFINTMYLDSQRQLWIGTENEGISVLDVKSQKSIIQYDQILKKLSKSTINCIFEDSNNDIWIGTWGNGLYRYNQKKNELKQFNHQIDKTNSISGNIIKAIVQRENDKLWISTYGNGINILDLNTLHFTQVEMNDVDENNYDYIWTSFSANDNSLWFGSFGYGLFKLNSLKNTFRYQKIGAYDNEIRVSSMTKVNDDKFILGTYSKGLYLYNKKDKKFTKYNIGKSLKVISAVYLDSKNTLWVSTDSTLFNYSLEKKKLIEYKHDAENNTALPKGVISTIAEDEKGNIWLSYSKEKIACIPALEADYSKDVMSGENLFDGKYLELHGAINYFGFDKRNLLWVGTSDQLVAINTSTFEVNRLPINVASDMKEDHFGNIWVGTNGDGLYKIDRNKRILKHYGYEEGLYCLDIQTLQIDKRARVWVGTSCGFSVLNTETDLVANFSQDYGLKNYSINLHLSAAIDNGEFIFAGNNGINTFNPNLISKNFKPSKIYLTDVRVDNKSIAYENSMDTLSNIPSLLSTVDTIFLADNQSILTVKFAAINYDFPLTIQYAYKLEGYNNKWIETDGKSRSATFSKLPIGTYTLKIKSSPNKGSWSDAVKEITIVVEGSFFDTLLFKALLGLIGLIIFSYLLFLIFKRKELRSIVEEKRKAVQDLHEENQLIQFKNEQLNANILEYNQRINEMSTKYSALKEHLNHMYQNIVDITTQSNNTEFQSSELNELKNNLNSMNNDTIFDNVLELETDTFLTDFAKNYPQLTSTDLRICSLVRLNKTNKEIAQILNITLGSLEQSRYRIRKKMKLEKQVNLNDLILRF